MIQESPVQDHLVGRYLLAQGRSHLHAPLDLEQPAMEIEPGVLLAVEVPMVPRPDHIGIAAILEARAGLPVAEGYRAQRSSWKS